LLSRRKIIYRKVSRGDIRRRHVLQFVQALCPLRIKSGSRCRLVACPLLSEKRKTLSAVLTSASSEANRVMELFTNAAVDPRDKEIVSAAQRNQFVLVIGVP